MAAKSFIIVRTSFTGLHQWKDAPMEVDFLKALHRHIFYVEAKIPVTHNNRQLEFFMVKSFLDRSITEMFPTDKLGQVSCEMIAEDLMNRIMKTYGIRKDLSVYVSEDGENSGGVEI